MGLFEFSKGLEGTTPGALKLSPKILRGGGEKMFANQEAFWAKPKKAADSTLRRGTEWFSFQGVNPVRKMAKK